MKWLHLDPESLLARATESGLPPRLPTRGQSIVRGSLGFGVVSVIVFGVWALAGRWLSGHFGEAGFYAVCALIFIGLSGIALSPLVIGPVSPGRFNGLFALAFGAYAVAWCIAWFALRGKPGEWAGSLGGTLAMGLVLSNAFRARERRLQIILVLFISHSAGYFLGGLLYDFCRSESGRVWLGNLLDRNARAKTGMILWGLAYGIGFGGGLGYALYHCQATVRTKLEESGTNSSNR